MELLNSIPLLLGGSWASGVNLYLTAAALGISNRVGWIDLPGNLDALSHPLVIIFAILMFAIEFIVDKVPFVDSAWDSVHTFIRPLGGTVLGYMALADVSPLIQVPVALASGSIALDAHLTKAATRVAINTSPEPVTNSIASVTEDISVLGIIYLIVSHPVVLTFLVVLFLIISIWFLKKMLRFVKIIFAKKKD